MAEQGRQATDAEIRVRAEEYIAGEKDERFRNEVVKLLEANDETELAERFYTDLAFGTGGLRGIIAGGFNRMNPLVVQRATEGLARYVEAHGDRTAGDSGDELRAVIAYDSRHYSDEFALQVGLVFAAHGIRTYLFSALRPTPELSFAVRYLHASVGVVVTASHNPPEYNGYKVYWSDGAQIVAPHDTAIIDEVRAVRGTPSIISKDDAIARGLLRYIDTELDEAFVAMVKRQSIRPELLRDKGKDLKVVYTPLHGTGAMMVERVLGDLGVEVVTVPEQREPDGDFPTVTFPNPEEAGAMKMAVDLGIAEGADIVMGTDPDSDRLGIAVPDADGMRLITGNQLGVLLVDYVFGSLSDLEALPAKPVFVKTIVTTELQRKIAEKAGAKVFDTLTGFKHIATVMRTLDANPGTGTYVMGDEESYGYLIGNEVRDKDAVTAVLLTAEMALYHVSNGKSVLDRLAEIYQEYGFFREVQISRYFEGQSGTSVMKGLMKRLREEPPSEIGGATVVEIRDFLDGTARNAINGEIVRTIDLPSSNVLQYILDDEAVVSARPSGTEPKIKFYASVSSAPGTETNRAEREVSEEIEGITQWINDQIASAEQ